jgi:hypothetical protein
MSIRPVVGISKLAAWPASRCRASTTFKFLEPRTITYRSSTLLTKWRNQPTHRNRQEATFRSTEPDGGVEPLFPAINSSSGLAFHPDKALAVSEDDQSWGLLGRPKSLCLQPSIFVGELQSRNEGVVCAAGPLGQLSSRPRSTPNAAHVPLAQWRFLRRRDELPCSV